MNKDTLETLDPKDWELQKKLMHQMIEDAFDYTKNVRDRKIWQQMPQDVLDEFITPLPKKESSADEVYESLQKNVLPYPMGNTHPRFWAWYMGNGTISGAVGDFWAAIFNPNLGGGNHAGHKVEEQVVNWIKEIVGFPQSSSGLLGTGGSMANTVALTVARNVKAGYDIRKEGLRKNNLVYYASTEIHSCNTKAVELLGLGTKGLKKIKTNNGEILFSSVACAFCLNTDLDLFLFSTSIRCPDRKYRFWSSMGIVHWFVSLVCSFLVNRYFFIFY